MGVSVGTTEPAIHPNVLMEILGSSESVQTRIAEFEKKKNEAEEAFARLHIGTEARAAFDAATTANQEAAALLEKAKIDSDAALKVVGDATAQAAVVVRDAEAERDRIHMNLAAHKAAHEQWIAATRAEIAHATMEVDALRTEMVAAKEANLVALAEIDAQRAAARDAQRKANEAESYFKLQALRLQQAVADLTKSDHESSSMIPSKTGE